MNFSRDFKSVCEENWTISTGDESKVGCLRKPPWEDNFGIVELTDVFSSSSGVGQALCLSNLNRTNKK